MFSDWTTMRLRIGMCHWLSVGRGPGLQLPTKWAAITMGYDPGGI